MRPEDVVILHDPQTAGLVPRAEASRGAGRVAVPHRRRATRTSMSSAAGTSSSPTSSEADACVFSRRAYVPAWATAARTVIIQPSIDAFSPKNQELDADAVRAILAHVGLVAWTTPPRRAPVFTRHDGSPGRVDRGASPRRRAAAARDDPLVVQVSRWDRARRTRSA